MVDDEAPIREALVQTLEDHGYRAYTAEDGSDALALYFHRRGEFKLVLTDLAMAQMDGIALVRALRKMDPQREGDRLQRPPAAGADGHAGKARGEALPR